MIHTFRRWLFQGVDYDWMVGYFAAATALATTSALIGGACMVFAGLYLLVAFAPPFAPVGAAVWLIVGNAAMTALTGLGWLLLPWPGRRRSLAFVVYADLGLALVLLLIANPLAALPCTILFSVATSYVTTFHPPKVFAIHQVFVVAVSMVLLARSLDQFPDRSSEALVFGIVILLVLFLAPVSNYRLQVLQRSDLNSAFVDPLTGVRNRRGLAVAADEVADQATSTRSVVTAVVIDLDNFKAVNDTYGHHRGDVVIRRTARAITSAFPAPAATARTGGEEFVVVIAAPCAEAIDRAQKMVRAVASSDLGVTVSVGVASGQVDRGVDVDLLITAADHAMFAAKARGGNCIEVDPRESAHDAAR